MHNQHIYEIKSSLILQPGPTALTDGRCAAEDSRAVGGPGDLNYSARQPQEKTSNMAATVTAIYRYPVKGLSAEKLNRVSLTPGECPATIRLDVFGMRALTSIQA
jgi:hypothetical protein